MTKKKRKINWRAVKKALPYVVVGVVTLALVFVGSLDKQNAGMSLNLNAFAQSDYNVSVDQLSELYMVADLSDALGLASASDVASNYVLTTSMYAAGQTSSTGKLELPTIIYTGEERGVISYTVQAGETMESIATKYGLSTDQIRWSNGLKTTSVEAGGLLYLPSVPGIVYTVKSGDTVETIASRYNGNVAEIVLLNDLEDGRGLSEGTKIVIKDGVLPNTERPEYVAPVATYYYSYLGNTSERQNIEVVGYLYGLGGPYVAGQCTQWAWYNRQDLPSTLGNANTWAARAAAAGYTVNRTPAAGAVFQTSSGWYGHVGYVEEVYADGSIRVTEMNYNYRPYYVIRSTIPASAVGNFNYIH